ncbi:hypothetical protein CAC42_309 [Sphaceloma murrayae]|uniref:Uncharacterized protein n=1 Tax=Sphaceloma murrayae TaxID=2082308 RepID=A0A2K1QZW0_9PEZI|nr:hypothetical protein CAC42_309 [Sphaceloma murrayae]
MSQPSTPTTPACFDQSSFSALIMQSENEIRFWSGFPRDTLLRTQSTHSQGSKSSTSSLSHDVQQRSNHTTEAQTTQSPPIPARAPGHAFYLPKQSLRKRRSPRVSSLRELRAKDSEAQLRSVYEEQTLAYLNDTIQSYRSLHSARPRWSSSESSGEDDIKEEPDEDEQFFMAPEIL